MIKQKNKGRHRDYDLVTDFIHKSQINKFLLNYIYLYIIICNIVVSLPYIYITCKKFGINQIKICTGGKLMGNRPRRFPLSNVSDLLPNKRTMSQRSLESRKKLSEKKLKIRFHKN